MAMSFNPVGMMTTSIGMPALGVNPQNPLSGMPSMAYGNMNTGAGGGMQGNGSLGSLLAASGVDLEGILKSIGANSMISSGDLQKLLGSNVSGDLTKMMDMSSMTKSGGHASGGFMKGISETPGLKPVEKIVTKLMGTLMGLFSGQRG